MSVNMQYCQSRMMGVMLKSKVHINIFTVVLGAISLAQCISDFHLFLLPLAFFFLPRFLEDELGEDFDSGFFMEVLQGK